MKIVRMNGWKEVFSGEIREMREKELKELMKMSICLVLGLTLGYLASPLCQGLTLTYYVYSGHKL
jgi:hypothetical protein